MAIYSRLIENLTNGENYFVKVFTANHKGRINNRLDLAAVSAVPSAFPAEPSSYMLIGTYTTSQTWTAPEDGYYRIVLQGKSGNGAKLTYVVISGTQYNYVGAGGGGGACVISEVKLRKGDTLVIVLSSDSSININSSMESYDIMSASAGTDAVGATASNYTKCYGVGGAANGGNAGNYNGDNGMNTYRQSSVAQNNWYCPTGGNPGYTGGNKGGNGQWGHYVNGSYKVEPLTNGLPAFVEIYRGDTNIVAA